MNQSETFVNDDTTAGAEQHYMDKIDENTACTITSSSQLFWYINEKQSPDASIGIISKDVIGIRNFSSSCMYINAGDDWISAKSNTLTITGTTGTITVDDVQYTLDLSDGYILNMDDDGDYAYSERDFTHSIKLLTDESLIGISFDGYSTSQMEYYAYVRFSGNTIQDSISVDTSSGFSVGTITSIHGGYSYQDKDGYVEYDITGPISITPSNASDDFSVNWFLYPRSITVDKSLNGPEYDLIRMMPVIMIAGVVIASIGAFVINRRE